MRKTINKFLAKFGYSLEKTRNFKINNTKILKNVFNKSFDRKVLLSYIKGPFINKLNYEHTNLLECYTAGEIFSELGYNVDVINLYDNALNIDFSSYDIIYGMGVPITQSLSYPYSDNITRIVYATGCGPLFVQQATAKKVLDFKKRHNKLISKSSRYSELSLALLSCADKVIILGNNFTKSTFDIPELNINATCIPAFYYDTYSIDLNNKDFHKARKNILWFGSSGLLHKGLDLAIDAIKEIPDLTLHICGASEVEKDFFTHYKAEMSGKFNRIINHGFIKLESKEFRDLMDTCGAVIFPSISEGGSPSLLNILANGGLMPIYSKESGVDIDGFGIMISNLTLEGVKSSLIEYNNLSNTQLKGFSLKAVKSTRDCFSYDNYKLNLKSAITETINHKK